MAEFYYATEGINDGKNFVPSAERLRDDNCLSRDLERHKTVLAAYVGQRSVPTGFVLASPFFYDWRPFLSDKNF